MESAAALHEAAALQRFFTNSTSIARHGAVVIQTGRQGQWESIRDR
jgi:hypothetical protein